MTEMGIAGTQVARPRPRSKTRQLARSQPISLGQLSRRRGLEAYDVKIFTKKRAIAAVGAAAILGGSMAAYAYFTTTGSGSGSGTTGTSSALTLHATTSPGLYPGSSSTVTFTVDNPSPGHQYVTTIHL